MPVSSLSTPYLKFTSTVPAYLAGKVNWVVQGASTLGIDFAGTFSAGNLTIEGSNGSSTWTKINALDSQGQPYGTGIVDATGHYTFPVAGYEKIQMTQSSDYSGSIIATGLGE